MLRQQFRQYGGHEVKEMGDAFIVSFARASDAFACAVACQRALQRETGKLGNQEISPISQSPNFLLRVRMALHTGEVELKDGEYHGLVLHHAQRMLVTGHGGQILCSEATAALLQRHIEIGMWLTDLGTYRLRDVETPQRVFQVCYEDMAQSKFPPLNAETGYAHNLPLSFTRFFGREKELEWLQQILLSEEARLVTLTGAGGSGKTRLALEVGRQLVEPMRGAVWFVPLADLTDAQRIADVIRDALRLPRSPHVEPLEQVAQALSRQPSLLILDNLEHLLEPWLMVNGQWSMVNESIHHQPSPTHLEPSAISLVRNLLERIPTLKCLVTSRQLLGLESEREFFVPPLPTPSGEDTPEYLIRCESVQLFVDRAQAVRPDFQVTKANASAVAELCDRLEGIPLALELAAARIQFFTPAQMVSQLENRFNFLVSRRRDIAQRHRTLRAAVDWSYQFLPPEIQRFFARLSVFRGGWTVEAAEAVCFAELTVDSLQLTEGETVSHQPSTVNRQPSTDVLDYLVQLRECSLVLTEDRGAEMRFRMLETLREYGQDKLEESGEAEETRRRHRDWFLKLVEEAKPHLRGLQQGMWLDRLEADHDNLRVALKGCVDNGETEMAMRLGGSLWWLWYLRGHLSEGRERLAELLALPGAEARTAARASVLTGAGSLADRQSDDRAARVFYEEALAIHREMGNQAGVAASLGHLANVIHDDTATARSLAQQALVISRELGDRRAEGVNLLRLGIMAVIDGDFTAARAFLEESLAINRELGRPALQASALNFLGEAAYFGGDYAKARSLCEQSLALFREVGEKTGIAEALLRLGRAVCRQGDPSAARVLLEEGLTTYRELGSKGGVAQLLEVLSEMALAEGQAERAARQWGAAEALREIISIPLGPADRADYERNVAAARAALGEEVFAAAWTEGRAMTLDEAVAFALQGV